MQTWISSNSTWITPVLTAMAVVFAGIKLWMEIRASTTIKSDIATLKRSFVMRNWANLLALVAGTVAMVSVAWAPLSPASVLVGLMGTAAAGAGFAGVLVMETALKLADRVAAALAARE